MYITTKQAALIIGRTEGRVVQLIKEGKLKAQRFGKMYMIYQKDIDELILPKITGRPKDKK